MQIKANYFQLSQIDLNVLNQDNICYYDHLIKSKGTLFTFHPEEYVKFLQDANIEFEITE